MIYTEINKCRVCGNESLTELLNLGDQALTGVFHYPKEQEIKTPVKLVKCHNKENCCGLVQLKHNYDMATLYGSSYGYRSGLNSSMVLHLESLVASALNRLDLQENSTIVDIGSNDSTLLKNYLRLGKKLNLIGVDPTASNFKQYYPKEVKIVEEFFGNPETTEKIAEKNSAILITSIACFYDLEDPIAFCKEISKLLSASGLWIFEQAYLPATLKTNDYSVICAEHLEFYSLKQIEYILNKANLGIVDVEFNEMNGGSFRVYAALQISSAHQPKVEKINKILEDEKYLDDLQTYKDFVDRVNFQKNKLLSFINGEKLFGKTFGLLGASTKINVLLQYCGLTSKHISFAGEVNSDKFGKLTPGSHIPIIDEHEMLAMKPDYTLIGPWFFKEFFLKKPSVISYIENGGKLIFPLPKLEIISKEDL